MPWSQKQHDNHSARLRKMHADRKAAGLPGIRLGHRHSDEARRKMADAHARRRAEREKAGLPVGFPLSDEHKRAIGAASIRRHRENPMVDDKHPNWKGEEAGYGAIHDWVRRRWTFTGRCQLCNGTERKTELANKDHQYRRVLADWLELCRSCHRKMDNERLGRPRKFKPRAHCKKGHALTDENTYVRPGDGARCCRICRREGKRRRRAYGRSG